MRLTVEHSAGTYGQPVLVDDEDNTYGVGDILPDGTHALIYVMENLSEDPLAEKFVKMAGLS
ncbi:MAG: hypothetical protein U9Q05_06515 [Thermodesulfobacteriota bacterium]|nr:hypothetical protein [Thermodesulfobacteriota bacterium]